MVAAYRRFVDDFLHQRYSHVIRRIKTLDPNHLVSFRMSEAGNPLCPQGGYPFDLRSIAAAVDLFEPEGYGRFSYLYENTRTGVFTASYARSLINKPVMWAEYGITIWNGSNFAPGDHVRHAARVGYDHFHRMILESRSSGGNAWFYAGGYRFDERSDYGIIEPDGSPRSVQSSFMDYGPRIMNRQGDPSAHAFEPDVWLTYDRDLHANGIAGIYREVQDEFWRMVDQDQVVGLRTEGMGATSADVPLAAIGNRPFRDGSPPKFLNGAFDFVKIRSASGQWIEVENGARIEVASGKPVHATLSVTNTGDASWVYPDPFSDARAGTVYLRSFEGSDLNCSYPLSREVAFGETIAWRNVLLTPGIDRPMNVVLRMDAHDRTSFGQVFRFTLAPR
jgi:hypothetical protein